MFLELPADCVYSIFLFLDIPHLIICRFVCKNYNKIATQLLNRQPYKYKYDFCADIVMKVSSNSSIKLMRWARFNGASFSIDVCNNCVIYNNLDALKWIWNKFLERSDATIRLAIQYDRPEIAIWLIKNDALYDKNLTLEAALYGRLDILKSLRESNINVIWDDKVCKFAALNGQLEVIKWLKTIGIQGNKNMCKYAAWGGHLHVLKWAHLNEVQWDASVCEYATKGGHFEILKWLRERGAPWDYRVHRASQHNNRFEIWEWAQANGAPIN
jgi:hypothetical protein